MSDINLFQGGSTPLAGVGGDCGCGQFPSTYPSPARVASHYKHQHFTLADAFDPYTNTNRGCVMAQKASTTVDQTANVINKKIGILRIPAKHLLTHIRMITTAGNGVGSSFGVYIDRVNPTTGVLVSSVAAIAALQAVTMAADSDLFAPVSAATAGLWSDNDVLEVGLIFTAGPTTGTLASFTGSIQLVTKVDGFDYGRD